MPCISKHYSSVWELKNAPEYQFTRCGKCINVKRNTELRMSVKRYTKGFYIRGKFKSLSTLRKEITKIKQVNTPF